MKIEKKYIELFGKVVAGYKTKKLAEARIRDNFLKSINDPITQLDKDKQAIYTTFCVKKEDNTPDLTDKNEYQFKRESVVELNKELETLLNEEVELKTTEETKLFIENSEYEIQAGESITIDEIIKKL